MEQYKSFPYDEYLRHKEALQREKIMDGVDMLLLTTPENPYELEKGPQSICLSFRMENLVLITKGGSQWLSGPGIPVMEL